MPPTLFIMKRKMPRTEVFTRGGATSTKVTKRIPNHVSAGGEWIDWVLGGGYTEQIVAKEGDKCKWGVEVESGRCQGRREDKSGSKNSQTSLGPSL